MPVETTVPPRVYPPGKEQHIVTSIPASRGGISVSFSREGWPDGPVLQLVVIGSAEGNEFRMGPFQFSGGEQLGKDGQPMTTAGMTWHWPGESDGRGGRREIKVTDVLLDITVLQNIRMGITIVTL